MQIIGSYMENFQVDYYYYYYYTFILWKFFDTDELSQKSK